ncbi:acyltransferase [Pseudomonas sp. URMO17WK12:I12]|jgi:peptidoglycan/LPS O-acetylase OafA/YrhL|uniref:acyltransferase family protein n=1 Tax=Pseudomonas sp. URMO17WK12:I12 TaxID=1259797 RepID=UPI0004AD00BF|nr:acyltransferase [Pseudomonas sp. URMO17WK12:I12]
MIDPDKGRIVFLDYMRVFAFVTVLIGHKFFEYLTALANNTSQHITIRKAAEFLMPFCQGGAAGVVVFFLTSGYIITHVLQKEAATDFLIKRAFRIYPLYITAVILEAAFKTFVSGEAFPDTMVFVQRLLLIGDFYSTLPALHGVEWTLRIEVLFYLFMFAMKRVGVFHFQKLIPTIYMLAAYGLYKMPPIPSSAVWSFGYLNAYGPFLFIGSMLYLAERRLSSRLICTAASITMLYISMNVIAGYQPNWMGSHYAILALFIFMAALFLRAQFEDSKALRLFSDLTYSVYLFHNWTWDYFAIPIRALGLSGKWEQFGILTTLLLFCYAMHRTIETYGIHLSRPVINLFARLKKLTVMRKANIISGKPSIA